MQSVKATIGREKYRTILESDTNRIVSDEPVDMGGGDTGFSPDELLASALAACTVITLRMYADRKQYDCDSIEVTVSVDWDKENQRTNIEKTLKISGKLGEEEIARMKDIADKCPTHKTLLNPIQINTKVI